jgi:hypothetical protein
VKLLVLLPLCALAGCRRSGDENLGLRGRGEEVRADLEHLDHPAELARAITLPALDQGKRLGPCTRESKTKLAVDSGTAHDALEETVRLELDGHGASHLTRETSHGGGIEAIATGEDYYVKLRYGAFTKRKPDGDEVPHALDEAAQTLQGYLQVLGRFARLEPAGEQTVDGRRARGVRLTLSPSPATEKADEKRAWQAAAAASALDGEVWVDAESGAVLKARLTAAYTAQRGQRAIAVKLDYNERLTLGQPAKIDAPAVWSPAPSRPRPLLDRQVLLEGLSGHGRGAATE